MDPQQFAPTFTLPPQSMAAAGSGGRKEKARNTLPKVFLFATDVGKDRRILGCILVCNVVHVEATDSVYAVLGGVCPIADVAILRASDFRYRNVVSSLKEQVEVEIRSSEARCGGTLNSNFHAFATQPWRVWHVDEATSQSLMSDQPPMYFKAEKKHALAIGVDLEVVESLTEVVHDLNHPEEAPHPQAAASREEHPSVGGDGAPTSSPVAQTHADASRALTRLSTLADVREGGPLRTRTGRRLFSILCASKLC